MTRPAARGVVLGVLVTVAAVATACAPDTVSGHGAALVNSSTGPVLVKPGSTPPPPTAGFPSAPPSARQSSATASTGPTVTATGDGFLVTDDAGHFRVLMPAKPAHTSQPWSFGSYNFTVHIAVVTSPYIAIVEGEDVSPELSPKSFDLVLRSAVSGFKSTSGLRVVSQTDTSFQGHQAREAIFAKAGVRYRFLTFVYSGSQIYAMVAPEGPKFDALAGSFRPTI